MARKQRRYPPKFRREIVGLVRSGRSPEALARDFEPSASVIRKWVKQADLDEGHRSDGLTTFERQELRQARREIKRLRMEARHPKKSRGLVRPGERLDPKKGFEFVKAYRARFPIRVMCRVRSSLPQWVLRLVETSALESSSPGPGTSGKDRAGLEREPESLRSASSACRTESSRGTDESEACRSIDAGSRDSGGEPEAPEGRAHPEGPEGASSTGPGEPELRG